MDQWRIHSHAAHTCDCIFNENIFNDEYPCAGMRSMRSIPLQASDVQASLSPLISRVQPGNSTQHDQNTVCTRGSTSHHGVPAIRDDGKHERMNVVDGSPLNAGRMIDESRLRIARDTPSDLFGS
ncbi:uncharacterized protein LOC143340708 isoform X2 [Colletes latitarsis]|uniref:uncharacterized protein LOC143340708 isoform X2 n=1 Tax=Colletes latitarsis TaxID=2605962 RepID=UPI004035FCD5